MSAKAEQYLKQAKEMADRAAEEQAKLDAEKAKS
jgi:hypothetical protein